MPRRFAEFFLRCVIFLTQILQIQQIKLNRIYSEFYEKNLFDLQNLRETLQYYLQKQKKKNLSESPWHLCASLRNNQQRFVKSHYSIFTDVILKEPANSLSLNKLSSSDFSFNPKVYSNGR